MGTLVYVCPTTGHQIPPALKSIDPATKCCRGLRQRSFVRAVDVHSGAVRTRGRELAFCAPTG